MTEKDWAKLSIVAAFAMLFYWYVSRNKIAAGTAENGGTENTGNPMLDVYSADPSRFSIPQLQGTTVNVNVGNQGLAYLNEQYVPLFGFVGMAGGWR